MYPTILQSFGYTQDYIIHVHSFWVLIMLSNSGSYLYVLGVLAKTINSSRLFTCPPNGKFEAIFVSAVFSKYM